MKIKPRHVGCADDLETNAWQRGGMHTYCICCGHDACDYSRSVSTYPQNCPSTTKRIAYWSTICRVCAKNLCVNLGGVWDSKRQAGSEGGEINQSRRPELWTYLLFLSCIGKLANRPMTSSMLQCHTPANSVKNHSHHTKDLPKHVQSILPTSWILPFSSFHSRS